MVCFLAFVLETTLKKKLKEIGFNDSFQNLMIDLKQLKALEISIDGKTYLARTDLQGKTYEAFRAIGLRPPNKILESMLSI